MGDTSVVQDWLAEKCTWKMQTVLLTSFRGCDGVHKHDLSKPFTRLMRASILKNADKTTTFFLNDCDFGVLNQQMNVFLDDIDHYPMHCFFHLLHAAEILSYKHYDPEIKKFWGDFYQSCIHALHVNPETEEQLDERLKDNNG